MTRKTLYVLLIVALVCAGVVRAITITTNDICIDSKPLSEYLADMINSLIVSENHLNNVTEKLENLTDRMAKLSQKVNTTNQKLSEIYSNMPMKTFVNATLVDNVLFHKTRMGYAFVASHRFPAVADGSTVTFCISVPSSGNPVALLGATVTTTGKGYVQVYANPSITASGTAITPVNYKLDSTYSTQVSVEYGCTFTGGNLMFDLVVPGGKKRYAIGSFASVGEHVIMSPGTTLVITFTNTAGVANDVSTTSMWMECPNVQLP